jgi:hypothetical protein
MLMSLCWDKVAHCRGLLDLPVRGHRIGVPRPGWGLAQIAGTTHSAWGWESTFDVSRQRVTIRASYRLVALVGGLARTGPAQTTSWLPKKVGTILTSLC